jgi:hypothetical protein
MSSQVKAAGMWETLQKTGLKVASISAMRALRLALIDVYAKNYYSGVQGGGGHFSVNLTSTKGAFFTGSITGSVLTVTSVTNGQLAQGLQINWAGSTGNVNVASFGTGTGGPGTYNLSQSGLNVASTIMTADDGGSYIVSIDGTRRERDEQIANVVNFGAAGSATATVNDWAFWNAIQSMPKDIGANPLGTLIIPPAKYARATGDIYYTSMRLLAAGAALDYSAAAASVTAVTINQISQGFWTDTAKGDPMGMLSLIGPGSGTTSIGILVGEAAGGTLFGFSAFIGNITGFGVGHQQASNSYAYKLVGGAVTGNGVNHYFPPGLSNAAEQVELIGVLSANAGVSSVRNWASDLDLRIIGGSIDYDTSVSVDPAGDSITTLIGVHLEGAQNQISVKNTQGIGNPYVQLVDCTYTRPNGSTGAGATPIIDGNNAHISVRGGWVRIGAGTQDTFALSTGAYGLTVLDLGVVGTVTTIADVVGGSGQKFTTQNLAWTPALAFGGATTGIAYSSQTGTYGQHGNMVFASFSITLTSKGTAAGAATIGGLPELPVGEGSCDIQFYSNLASAISAFPSYVSGGNVYLGKTGGTSWTAMNDADFTNTTRIDGFLKYMVA